MLKSAIDRNKFETLIEINALINSEYSDGKELLKTIIESATRLMEADASSLLLLNPENNKLYFEIALGAKGPEVQRFSLNLGEGIAGWVAANNRSLIVNDVESDAQLLGLNADGAGVGLGAGDLDGDGYAELVIRHARGVSILAGKGR